MNLPEPTWLILAPHVRERLESRTDSGNLLPVNMFSSVLRRIKDDKKRTRELMELAGQIQDHLNSCVPGWALELWPPDLGECLFIGSILSRWMSMDLGDMLLELSKEEFEEFSLACKTSGLSVEQLVIERLDER
jgi:hypothetical protein